MVNVGPHLAVTLAVFGDVITAYGLLAAVTIVASLLGIWWMIWFVRISTTTFSWRHAGDELGLTFESHHSDDARDSDESFWETLGRITPPKPRFELSDPGGDRPVHIYTDTDSGNTRTVWDIDTTDILPEWLSMRPAGLEATADGWLDLEDVKLGHDAFDDRAIVAGRGPDQVREFFWDTDLAEPILEIFDDVGRFQIADGKVRLTAPGITRQSRPLRDNVERVRTIADRLEAAVTADEEVEADFDEAEAPEEAEASVHVYD